MCEWYSTRSSLYRRASSGCKGSSAFGVRSNSYNTGSTILVYTQMNQEWVPLVIIIMRTLCNRAGRCPRYEISFINTVLYTTRSMTSMHVHTIYMMIHTSININATMIHATHEAIRKCSEWIIYTSCIYAYDETH